MTHPPGVTLLASLTGRDPEEVATKPGVALRAIVDLTKDMARLAADRASSDPAVRAAAERRTAEIAALAEAARAAEPGDTSAKDRFQASVEDALRKVLRDLERART